MNTLTNDGDTTAPTATVTATATRAAASQPRFEGRAAIVTGAAGIWLFYVQHQFEDTYWQTNGDWSFDDAALHGSSYLKLPRVLQFFTGNIGFHHVHHLSARVPNYRLQECHEAHAGLRDGVTTLTLREALLAPYYALWDEERGQMMPFPSRRVRVPAPPAS